MKVSICKRKETVVTVIVDYKKFRYRRLQISRGLYVIQEILTNDSLQTTTHVHLKDKKLLSVVLSPEMKSL